MPTVPTDPPPIPAEPPQPDGAAPDAPTGGRRGRWLWPLGSVVAVAAVVAGATLLVSRGGDDGAAGSPPPLRLVGAAPAAPGEAAAVGSAAPADSAVGSGPLRVSGTLPTTPDHAAVHPLTGGHPSDEQIRRLASALGVTGQVEKTAGGRQVRQSDTGLLLRVTDSQPGVPWTLGPQSTPAAPPTMTCLAIVDGKPACPQPAPRAGTGGGAVGGGPVDSIPEQPAEGQGSVPEHAPQSGSGSAGSPAQPSQGAQPAGPDTPVVDPDQPSAAAPPDSDAVRQAARPVLDTLGLSAAHVEVVPAAGHADVVADPVVDGLPTSGVSTRLSYDGDGNLVSANGWFATPTTGPDYPLVGAADVLDRANGATCEPCPTPAGTVTGAVPALLGQFEVTSDGTEPRLVLVPAWRYDVALAGGDHTALFRVAVDPRYLRQPSSPVTHGSTTDKTVPNRSSEQAGGGGDTGSDAAATSSSTSRAGGGVKVPGPPADHQVVTPTR